MASLSVKYQSNNNGKPRQAYTLHVEVVSAVDMPAEVFMFQRSPYGGDDFVCIADPVDLLEVPLDTPDLLNEVPYYRSRTVTLVFRSIAELNATMADIQADLAELVDAVNAPLTVEQQVTYA